MFAIIKTGGRQVKVTPGAFVQLEGTAGEPGGSSSRYPAGTLVAGVFTDQFANPPSDFSVREGSPLKRAAPALFQKRRGASGIQAGQRPGPSDNRSGHTHVGPTAFSVGSRT